MEAPQGTIKKIILVNDLTDICKDASYHAMKQAQTYKAELKADLIILGAQGYTGWNRYVSVLGSVAEYVVKYASCAVLSIRQDNLNKNHSPPKMKSRSKKKASAGTLEKAIAETLH